MGTGALQGAAIATADGLPEGCEPHDIWESGGATTHLLAIRSELAAEGPQASQFSSPTKGTGHGTGGRW